MKTYNGHRSWNAWNVSLWIGNTENIYNYAMSCIKTARKWYDGKKFASDAKIVNKATRQFMQAFGGSKTPDGATYNALSVKLALEGYYIAS